MSTVQDIREKKPLETSRFYMWRVIIAIAHADENFSEQERAYFDRIFANLDRLHGLTAEQKSTFAADFKKPGNIADLMRNINDPAARGDLIYFGGLLARADGVLSPQEDAILKKLRADQLAGLDLDKIRADAKKAAADELFKLEMTRNALRPQDGLMGALDAFMLYLGIDLMDI